jgi:glutathione S-transferase
MIWRNLSNINFFNNMSNKMTYQLYGNELSLFTRKLEAALIFYGLPFENRPNDPVINQRAGTHQIPVLLTPENWALADTTPIMQLLDARYPERAMFPKGLNGLLVRVLEEFLDEWIPRVMVHYRWHYPESADFAAMRLGNGNEEIAKGIVAWGPRACRATGTESEVQQKAAEQEYLRMLEAAEKQLGQTAYLLGDRPCAVDAMMIGGFRGHTYADPVPKRVVSNFPRIVEWIETKADQWDGAGSLASFDSPTDFARHILDEMPSTYQPFILGNKKAVDNEEKFFKVEIYNEQVSYLTRPYPEKSRLMVLEYIQTMTQEEQSLAKSWFQKVNLLESFS